MPRSYRRGKATVKLTGIDAIDKKLKELEPKLANKLSTKVMRKAAKPVLAAARAKVPVDEGTLKKSLTIRAMTRRHKHKVGARVMTKPPSKWQKSIGSRGDAFHALFVEFGWKYGAPQPFLIPALREKESEVKAILKEEVENAIQEEWAKQASFAD